MATEREPISGVEGDWEGFHFRVIRPDDLKVVEEHVATNFLRDEIICSLLGPSAEFAEDFALLWGPSLAQGLSVLAIDRSTNKIAGVRISCERRKDSKYSSELPPFKSTQGRKVAEILDLLGGHVDIYEKFGVDAYAEFLLVSVDREFRGRGLAMELYNRSVTLLRSHGLRYVKCVFSSPYSRRNGEKLGFQELLRLKLIEMKDGQGETYLPSAPPDEIVTLAVLKL